MSTKSRLHLRPAVLVTVVITASGLLSCGRDVPQSPAVTPIRSDAVVVAAAASAIYVCPMHPHITSPAPGTCPICGMTRSAISCK